MENSARKALRFRAPRSGRLPGSALALQGAGVGTAAALAVLLLGLTGVWNGFEGQTWDLRVRTLMHPEPSTSQIELVQLDQVSLDWAEKEQDQGWPWPREYYAKLVDFLARGGARVVAFDVIFSEASGFGVSDDQTLADSMKALGKVVIAQPTEQGALVGLVPELQKAAAAVGHVKGVADADGVYRRVLPNLTLDGQAPLPSLAYQAFRLGQGNNAAISLDSQATVLLRYRGPAATHRRWSIAELLNSELQILAGEKPQVDPEVFRGKYVVFGFTAQGLRDLQVAPMDASYPGMEVQATVLDNLLARDSPREVPPFLTWVLVLAWALAAALVLRLWRRPAATVLVFTLLLVVPVSAAWAGYVLGWWVALVEPLLAGLVAAVSVLLVNYAGEGRQKRFIQEAFSQYLSPVVIEQLVADPGKLTLGGEKRCLSIFFSDIQGFTSISERLDPQSLTGLLNDYLSEMTQIIYQFGGTIDKYEGDAIIAFWNAPVDVPDHASRAVQASLACQKRLAEISPRLRQKAGRDVQARIGLNSGDVVIGNMGSAQRFNYTFLGDAGNLASRLEGLNKQFGTYFLASENTKALAGDGPDLHWREISRVRVVGKATAVTVFEPLDAETARAKAADLKAFHTGLEAFYRGDFEAATRIFTPLADRDPPSAHYLVRLQQLQKNPPAAWDGVWDSTEK